MFRKLFYLFSISLLINNLPLTAQETNSQLAYQYYQGKEYEKAVVLYEKLFDQTQSRIYFNFYTSCLVELEDYKTAERDIKKQIRKHKNDVSYLVDLGYVYKAQGQDEEAQKQYMEAIEKVPANKQQVIQLANAFNNRREYDLAVQTYLRGREKVKDYGFHLELAYVYTILRKQDKMIEVYLDLLAEDATQLDNVQSRLQYSVVNNPDESFRQSLKVALLKRLQSPYNKETKNVYSELLIWLFVQQKDFGQALIQVKALDKRNNEYGKRLIDLAELALSNREYDVALEAYQYVIDKGEKFPFFFQARYGKLNVLYQKVLSGEISSNEEIADLENSYINTIYDLGKNSRTVLLMKDLAHLQAFYLNKPQEAINRLRLAIDFPRADQEAIDRCRLELADVLLFTGETAEATLIYAQVEKANEQNPIGHEAKFRKAKLAYYIGNFEWAQAQLDVLKASTSKLIANDAAELSLLISDNMAGDTLSQPLEMFAHAELLTLRNQYNEAIQVFDSLLDRYPTNSLVDEIYFKKAEVAIKKHDYTKAIEHLTYIADSYAYDVLGDDTQFKMAEIYHYNLDDPEKAMEHYKEIIINYSGSIYVVEARKRFRALRGDGI